jgi:hypothetical protein
MAALVWITAKACLPATDGRPGVDYWYSVDADN